jgi:hypothetical protein
MHEQENNYLARLDRIESAILILRGERVILDEVLAGLYGVPVKVLNQAVKRNARRFPEDFMFQLTEEEHGRLRSQSVTLNAGRGRHRKYRPYAFTEQGIAMLSSVLSSEQAIRVNIEIMRAFVRLRRWMATHADLARKLAALESKYDVQFRAIFEAIRRLMALPEKKRKPIGFEVKERSSAYSVRRGKSKR